MATIAVPSEPSVPPTPTFVMPQTVQQYFQFKTFRDAVQSRAFARHLLMASLRSGGSNGPSRKRLSLFGGRIVFFVAHDYIVGVALWIVIAILALDFFFIVVPFADSDELRQVFHVAPNATHPRFSIGLHAASMVVSVRPFVVPSCSVLIVVTQVLLAWLIVADPGFVKSDSDADSDDGEQLQSRHAAALTDDELHAMAVARLEPTPPHWTVEQHGQMLETVRDQILYEREWIESVETDVHMCPVCRLKVRGFDHHCGVVGACIGRRTMPFFVLFLTSAAIMLFLAEGIAAPLFVFNIVEGRFSKDGNLPPLDTIGTAFFFVAALYLGLYTIALSVWYWLQTLRGDFSSSRRKKNLLVAEWQRAVTPGANAQSALRRCMNGLRCSSAAEMLAPFCRRDCQLARK